MLKVQDVVAKSGSVRLEGVSFKVEPGEVLAVLGSSDSGKNLLGQVIAGTHKPLSGEVSIGHYRVGSGSDKARIQIGYLPNPAPTEEFLTGYELLDLIGSIYHLAPAVRSERIQFLIDLLEIGPMVYSVLEKAPADIRQKVALASAVIHSPKLVVLDEPSQLLDFNGPRLVGELLKSLTRESTSVLLITDSPELAQELADRFLIIVDGHRLIEGTMAQLLNQSHPNPRTLRGVLETIDY